MTMTTSELSASKGGSGQGVLEQCFMADNFAASTDARPGCNEPSMIIAIMIRMKPMIKDNAFDGARQILGRTGLHSACESM